MITDHISLLSVPSAETGTTVSFLNVPADSCTNISLEPSLPRHMRFVLGVAEKRIRIEAAVEVRENLLVYAPDDVRTLYFRRIFGLSWLDLVHVHPCICCFQPVCRRMVSRWLCLALLRKCACVCVLHMCAYTNMTAN